MLYRLFGASSSGSNASTSQNNQLLSTPSSYEATTPKASELNGRNPFEDSIAGNSPKLSGPPPVTTPTPHNYTAQFSDRRAIDEAIDADQSSFVLGAVPTRTAKPSRIAPAVPKRGNSCLVPRGKLTLEVVSARNLACTTSRARPYVVVEYDQNEFVSREPIDESKEKSVAKGVPEKKTTSSRKMGKMLDVFRGGAGSGGSGGSSARSSPRDSPRAVTPAAAPSPLSQGSAPPSPLTPVPGATFTRAAPAAETPSAASDRSNLPSETSSPPLNIFTWKHQVTFDVMDDTFFQLVLQLYDRSVEDEVFLGTAEIEPRLTHGKVLDAWFPLAPHADDVKVTGDIHLRLRFDRLDARQGLQASDFEFLRMIGRGTFGRVFQVRKKDTQRIYAMKVLSKREIVAKKEIAHTIGERNILLKSSDSPFLLGLKFSFQSELNLYLVMDYKAGGELFHHLTKEGRFTEDRARFYVAEITLAFEHLHKYDIVYRDLKPENILLDTTGHIVLCDFGLSKPNLPKDALTNTFCGTTEYLAPEVLLDDNGYSKLVDFWSLGVLLFEMCCGWSPFYAEDTQEMYKLICFGKIRFPKGVIQDAGKQFVKGLLNRNPRHRLGAERDTDELKEHAFFASIDWDALAARQIQPPFKPYVDSDASVSNFDAEFTEADLREEMALILDETSDASESESSDDDLASSSFDLKRNFSFKRAPKKIRDAVEPPMGRVPRRRRSKTQTAESEPAQGAVEIRRSAKVELSSSVQENFRGFTFSGEGESLEVHGRLRSLALCDSRASLRSQTPERSHTPERSEGDGEGDDWEDMDDAASRDLSLEDV